MRGTMLAVLLFVLPAAQGEDSWRASGRNGAVSCGGRQPHAAAAAIEILKSGGNAVDAAVATLLVLSVTDSGNYCFGGEVPIIVYDAKRRATTVISGLGAAPRLATLEYFRKHKGGKIPGGGDPTTAAVPGSLDALVTALDRFGTKTFEEVSVPVLRVLGNGSRDWHSRLALTIRRLVAAERSADGDRRRGLRNVSDFYYRGPIAREIDAWMRKNGGLLRYVDMATHKTFVEDPVTISYRGYTIAKCGPWTQGPYLLQTLRLLEAYDLKAMGHNSPDYVHVLIEAMKLGLADRDTYYADPHFEDVPLRELLSDRYTEMRRKLIDMKKASDEQRPGDPRNGKPLLGTLPQDYTVSRGPIRDTTTCLVADRWGNFVAATPSGWGGVMVEPLGMMINSRLRSLNSWEGHPNCIEPGKRPRITLTPTIVFKNGEPVYGVSVAGGDWQDQVTLQVLLNHLEFGMHPDQAVTAPRFGTHHLVGSFNQDKPQVASLSAYRSVGEETLEALRGRGHKVRIVRPPFWHPCALSRDPETGVLRAAGDPNARRRAAAY